jgi:hypothetical protein
MPSDHPILLLLTDVSDFLEAIEPETDSKLAIHGYEFLDAMNDLYCQYRKQADIQSLENCYSKPDQ